MKPGVFIAKKKNGELYFRSSITYKNKHISLGSYESENAASKAYKEAGTILFSAATIDEYSSAIHVIPFHKYVSLINFRDNNVYFNNPIYLKNTYFNYYLSEERILIFDIEDLFYYASHKIQQRNNRLFVADYGMQLTLQNRYGIKKYAVEGRDYKFLNGDSNDYRYENIKIFSKYTGVWPQFNKANSTILRYKAVIHINGNFIIGYYDDEITAAIAYNKAADYLSSILSESKAYSLNYIEELSPSSYAQIYSDLNISAFINRYTQNC